MGNPGLKLDPRALDFLTQHHWPGNVRELMNVLRSAVLMSRSGTIELEVVSSHPIFWEDSESEEPQGQSGTVLSNSLPTLGQAEKELIQKALQVSGGNKSHAARLLGISRSHLRYRMMLHDL